MPSRVVVQFKEAPGVAPIPYRDGAENLGGRGLLDQWQELRKVHPDITLRTLVRQRKLEGGANAKIEASLGKLWERANERPEKGRGSATKRRVPDPRTFFFLQTAGDPRDLAARLRKWPEVELAYWDQPGREPQVYRSDDPGSVKQLYLDPAPLGLGAEAAWLLPGGDGSGVGVVDVERGWYTSHPDLYRKGRLKRIFGKDLTATKVHGVMTLGVIVALDNTKGVVGVAPAAGPIGLSSWHDPSGNELNSVENAIYWALTTMRLGDVLVLEIQKDYAAFHDLPAEASPGIHAKVMLATGAGVVVVAAAGNGGHDLDQTGNPLVDTTPSSDFKDSGSIIVGAAQRTSESLTNPKWKRWSESAQGSNYGKRVDCFGMASGVWTTSTSKGYDFYGGTSAATAMVAGAALALQGAALGKHGKLLSPEQMRNLLRQHGTPTHDSGDRIGRMPNLALLTQEMLTMQPDLGPGPVLLP